MKTAYLTILALACTLTARADLSYTQTRRSAQGMGAAPAAESQTSTHYIKGQKMKVESAATASIIDFQAQTITAINHDQKTYTVTKFSGMRQAANDTGAGVKIDLQETGQSKRIGDFNARQLMLSTSMQNMAASAEGAQMQMEMEVWISSEVPGAQEARAFFQKNGARFPWASMAATGNPEAQKAMAEMQRKLAAIGTMPVLQITRMKIAGAGAGEQIAQIQQGMAEAMKRAEEMKKQGGEQAKMGEQIMARMGRIWNGAGGNSLFEITIEFSGFSTEPIPDSVFAVPHGYRKR